MNKVNYILLFLLILISLTLINAEQLTGKVSAQETNVSVTILLPPPIMNIIHPENKTYLYNESFPFNYTSYYEDLNWYNLNNINNITITDDIFINVTEGSHIINLFGNNSAGNSTENITFTINLSLLTILYEVYEGAYRGDSTDFTYIAYEDLQNLSNIILEHTIWGKLFFNEAIDVENDSNISDKIVDIDSNINITLNRIEMNTSNLPNFNKESTLFLYNIPFNDPRLLRNGEVCPSSICTFESFSGGIMKFNVTEFSIYSTEETPTVTTVTTIIGGGGGGGGTTIAEKEFKIDKGILLISLRQEDSIKEVITITNTDTTKKIIDLTVGEEIKKLIIIPQTRITLLPGESKEIAIFFSASKEDLPKLYSGKIFFEDQKGAKDEIAILIDVESKQALLDLSINILEKPAIFFAGKEVIAEINIFNLVSGENEIEIIYSLIDEKGNIILEQKEIIKIKDFTNITKTIKLSEEINLGSYIFKITSDYNGKTASASELFVVTTKFRRNIQITLNKIKEQGKNIMLILLTLLGIYLLILILKKLSKKRYYLCKRRKKKKTDDGRKLLKYLLKK